MNEITDLINEVPETLTDEEIPAPETTDEEVETDEEEGTEEEDEEQGSEEGTEEEEEVTPPAPADDEDEDLIEDLGEEEVKEPVQPINAPAAAETDESQFILKNLPKIAVNVLVPSADGKTQETKQVEVYGWGDLPRNMLGFTSPYEQGVFTASAQNNELKARELQGQFRQQRIKADTEAYTLKENRGIARDLRQLRQDGLFPKFKGLPGSTEFNNSDGAKEFDKVVAFMNEQNDEAGRAANAGEAFYHISFRQAYRMLHPEQFDKAAIAKRRQTEKNVARRVKGGGGTTPGAKTTELRRVSNITDLASDFAEFQAANGGTPK